MGKMMKSSLIILFFLAIAHGVSVAGEPAEIEMVDGSIIRAEILTLRDGVFTVRSNGLGTLEIKQSRIRTIRQGTPGGTARRDTGPNSSLLQDSAAQVKTLAEAMIGDREIMDRISLLSKDPDIMDVMGDPEIMKAVSAGDVAALMSNDKFLKVVNNPAVQEIMEKVNH